MQQIAKLLTILADPLNRKPLRCSADETTLTESESGRKFPVTGGIPHMLPPQSTISNEKFDYTAHYQEDAVVYDYFNPPEGKTEGEERRRLHDFILKEIPRGQGWILDAGCGGGWLAQHLISSGRPIISADISDVNPRKAVEQFRSLNHFALIADGNFLPILPDSLECIVASEIMEHVPDPAQFIASLYRSLRPGGKLIITTPYNEFIRYSLCVHCNRNTPHNAHLHSFTEESVRKFFPPGAIAETRIFSAKIILGLRVLPLLKWLPFGMFKTLDALLIMLSGNRASRLMIVISKP